MATAPMLLHHDLPSGARVRLRLPVRTDVPSLTALLGADQAAELLRFDPHRRAVLVAVDFEQVVGVGAIDVRPDAQPDLIRVTRPGDHELAGLLREVLLTRARQPRRAPAERRRFLRRPRRP